MIYLPKSSHLIDLSDSELVEISLSDTTNAADAQNLLLKRCQPTIFNIIKKFPPGFSEDLEILGYLGVLRTIPKFDINSTGRLSTYAKYYIWKECVAFISKEKTKSDNESYLIEFEDEESNTNINERIIPKGEVYSEIKAIEDSFQENIVASILQSFILNLSYQQRNIVNLVFFQGFSLAEAADELGISKPRVTQILNRIKVLGKDKLSYLNN